MRSALGVCRDIRQEQYSREAQQPPWLLMPRGEGHRPSELDEDEARDLHGRTFRHTQCSALRPALAPFIATEADHSIE